MKRENCIIIGCKAYYCCILIRFAWESNKMFLVVMLKINGLISSLCTPKTRSCIAEECRLTTERVLWLCGKNTIIANIYLTSITLYIIAYQSNDIWSLKRMNIFILYWCRNMEWKTENCKIVFSLYCLSWRKIHSLSVFCTSHVEG